MPLFTRSNLIFSAHPEIAVQMRPLIAALVADTADGFAYRCAIRHWLWSERPVTERFVGHHNVLRIDGPYVEVGSHSFPMGGMVNGPAGWRQFDPIETKDLLFDIRSEIDVTINRALHKSGYGALPVWTRPEIDRSDDDPQAIATMIDWVQRKRRIEALHVR